MSIDNAAGSPLTLAQVPFNAFLTTVSPDAMAGVTSAHARVNTGGQDHMYSRVRHPGPGRKDKA
jgi:hypothetical protein